MTLKNNRAPLLCYLKLCASFRGHELIQTGITVRKGPSWVKIDDFFEPCDLETWQMTLKKNRAPLLSNIKLCASFHPHMWIQTGVTVRKRLSWVLTPVIKRVRIAKYWRWAFGVTHISISKLSHHCFRYLTCCLFNAQAITWTKVGLLPTGTQRTNCSEI